MENSPVCGLKTPRCDRMACPGSDRAGDQIGSDLRLNLGWLLCHSVAGWPLRAEGRWWPGKSLHGWPLKGAVPVPVRALMLGKDS